MKVCIIVQNYYPGDVRVRREANALRSFGHDVSLISIMDGHEPKEENVNGVSVYRVKLWKKRGGLLRYLFEYTIFFLYAFFKVNQLDLKYKFDVIHINNLPDFLVFCAIVQKIRGKRIVLDMHEITPEFYMSKYHVGIRNPIIRLLIFIEKISLKFADDIITVNESIKKVFNTRSIPGKNIEVVMNTMDESMVNSREKSSHNGFNCVYHGTLTEIYGIDTAIIAFSKVCKNINNITFHIFGDGPLFSQLKSLVEELKIQPFVKFYGRIPHQVMVEKLAEMDLGILASPKDIFLNLSFSNKLAEYICLKIPVISSDLDAVKYYFNDDQILYFEGGNVEDLSRKIVFAYKNRKNIDEMAEKAFGKYKELNWGIMAIKYVKVIEGGTT